VSAPNAIKIDDVEYVQADSDTPGDIKIAVLDRGLVYVGRIKREQDFVCITNAKSIRVLGTTKGIGGLVDGPTKDTKLDYFGTVRVPFCALISLIDVNQSMWKLFEFAGLPSRKG